MSIEHSNSIEREPYTPYPNVNNAELSLLAPSETSISRSCCHANEAVKNRLRVAAAVFACALGSADSCVFRDMVIAQVKKSKFFTQLVMDQGARPN